MLVTQGDKPVHMPANPSVFEFDAEVSKIFPDMAKRAIPMYHEAHRAHVAMLRNLLSHGHRYILDVGASRGAFFTHLKEAYPDRVSEGKLHLTAVDNSTSMCNYLQADFPEAKVYHDDLIHPAHQWASRLYDVVVMNYVLQFIPVEHQIAVLKKVLARVAPGGYFLFGHKELLKGVPGMLAQDEYLQFRARNGYTPEEIAAKTTALKGSMFQLDNATVIRQVKDAGFVVQETTRWMAFNTFLAQKV